MIDGSEKRKLQLVFELEISRVYEKRCNFLFIIYLSSITIVILRCIESRLP